MLKRILPLVLMIAMSACAGEPSSHAGGMECCKKCEQCTMCKKGMKDKMSNKKDGHQCPICIKKAK